MSTDATKPKRSSGFYWVNHERHGWVVAWWNGYMWFYEGHSHHAANFTEIDERRIVREETERTAKKE